MEEIKDYQLPSWDVSFMKHVYLCAERSKDPRTKIGAVLVKDKRIISGGYNGFPIGVLDLSDRYNDRETKYKFIVHAEHNCVLTAAKLGISTLNTTLFSQGIPCCDCSKSLIQGGVKEIVVHKQWQEYERQFNWKKWIDSSKISEIMFNETGIKIRILDSKLNMSGYLDGKIISI